MHWNIVTDERRHVYDAIFKTHNTTTKHNTRSKRVVCLAVTKHDNGISDKCEKGFDSFSSMNIMTNLLRMN